MTALFVVLGCACVFGGKLDSKRRHIALRPTRVPVHRSRLAHFIGSAEQERVFEDVDVEFAVDLLRATGLNTTTVVAATRCLRCDHTNMFFFCLVYCVGKCKVCCL